MCKMFIFGKMPYLYVGLNGVCYFAHSGCCLTQTVPSNVCFFRIIIIEVVGIFRRKADKQSCYQNAKCYKSGSQANFLLSWCIIFRRLLIHLYCSIIDGKPIPKGIFRIAQEKSATVENAARNFRNTGIWPINPDISSRAFVCTTNYNRQIKKYAQVGEAN